MVYGGPGSVRDAATLREQMAATVDLARRARVDAREYLWNAREAERALGRMILAAREAGDLAGDGGDRHSPSVSTQATLTDLGISRDLAAHAVSLAKVSDDVWRAWHAWDVDPTQGAVSRSAREYLSKLEAVKAHANAERNAARQLRERKAEIERELAAVADRAQRAVTVDIPPLRDEETAAIGVDIVVSATAVEEMDDRDRINGDRWLAAMRRIEQLVTVLEQTPPPLPDDRFADLTVLSARDLARRITANTAIWLRAVNDQYAERIGR